MGERYVVKTDRSLRRDIMSAFQGEPPDEIEYEKAEPYTQLEQRVLSAVKTAIEKMEGAEVHCEGCDGEDRGDSVPQELRDLQRSIERHDKRLTPLTSSEREAQEIIRRTLFPSLLSSIPTDPMKSRPITFEWVEDRLNPA